jgi:hypothetical protein
MEPLSCPTALAAPTDAAGAVITAVAQARRDGRLLGRNVLTAWLGA